MVKSIFCNSSLQYEYRSKISCFSFGYIVIFVFNIIDRKYMKIFD